MVFISSFYCGKSCIGELWCIHIWFYRYLLIDICLYFIT